MRGKTSSKAYWKQGSESHHLIMKKLRERIDRNEVKLTDEMVFPPTFSYLPSPRLITYMINRASQAKQDPETKEYELFF